MKRWLKLAVLGLVLGVLIPLWAVPQSEEKLPSTGPAYRGGVLGSDLLDRIAETSNPVRDLSAQVDFQIRLYTVGLTFNVGGDLYYKKPDKMRLALRDVPDFLAKRENDALRTTNVLAGLRRDLRERYIIRIMNETGLRGGNCYILQLTPKTENGISRILLWVNSSNYTMPRVIIRYADGSSLLQEKSYEKEDNVYVVEKMESNFNSSDMKAEILATFRNYQINKGLTDNFFKPYEGETSPVSVF